MKYIKTIDELNKKKFIIIDDSIESNICLIQDIDSNVIHATSFYTFDKNTSKLKKITKELILNIKDSNIIYQSDNATDCLIEMNRLYGDKSIKYKKYLIANTHKRFNGESYGIFEIQNIDKSWEALYKKSPIVKLIVESYNSKIFKTVWTKNQSLAAYKIDDNNILYQTNSYDDAYEYLETLSNQNKYNL